MKYKKYCCCMVCMFLYLGPLAHAQSTDHNYVKTVTMLDSTETKYNVSIDYFDGIGRLSQKITGVPPSSRYAHYLYQYDQNGRVSKEWIPVSDVTAGICLSQEEYSSKAIARDASPSKQYHYDALNRVTSVEGPGDEFGNHSSTYEYATNWLNEVKYFQATASGIIYTNSSQVFLYDIEKHTDADGNVYSIYKDFMGRTAVERRAQNQDTYYIYDQYGQLRCVLPPAASIQFTTTGQSVSYNSDVIKRYAYLYSYDNRGRCVEKKLPGCEPQRFYYDKNDRLTFMDDGNLRDKNRMRFYLYDKFGRNVVKGTCKTYSSDITSISIYATCWYNGQYDAYNANISLEEVQLEEVSFYDLYSNLRASSTLTSEEQGLLIFPTNDQMESAPTDLPQEKLVCTKTYQLDNSGKYTVTVFFYDEKGQLICSNSTNHLGGTDINYTDYTFTGKPKKTLHLHNAPDKPAITESVSYHYDRHDRLVAEFYRLNGEISPVLCTYTYDDFGRLLRKAVGGETVTYEYNVRDWPTVISSRKFKEYMIYASVPSGVSVAPPNPCYNGNLSGVRYKYGEGIICGFDYTYDNMNRLIKSRYGDNPSMGSGRNNAYTEEFSYDCMGNVTSLTRNGFRDDGTCGVIDELAHFYNGNQLVCVENYQAGAHYTGAFSYQDNDDSGEEYAYDKNGNLVKNLDRNISSIQYNTLNLPTRITTKDQNTYEAEYTYDGQGRKLRATYQKKVMDIVAPARPLTKTLAMSSRFEGLGNSRVRPETIIQDTIIHGAPIGDYSEFSQTDYCGNIIYRGNRATVLNAHGYTNIDTDAATGESTAMHYYYLKDHLGNNRVVFRDDGLVVQENHYYAYGNLTADCYGSDTQQYKYNGKELDRKLGIDLYDYGARWYDATGRLGFTTIDPLCEEDYSVSPYVYCRDNPIKYVDKIGLAPGDPFKTMDEAAFNFGLIYNYWSIKKNAEYTGAIYQYEKDGTTFYSYMASSPQGKSKSNYNNLDTSTVPNGIRPQIVATIHTHGADDSMTSTPHEGNEFSKTDINADVKNYKNSKGRIKAGYLCTTNGTLMKHMYNRDTGKWNVLTFKGEKNMLPSDANDNSHNKYTTKFIDEKKTQLNYFLNNITIFLEERRYADR
ncbi:MAG: DUF4329 domain-containing protein [Prevotella sp.]|nr:DUF4329 domain-containing protein [Prevotella sp.]